MARSNSLRCVCARAGLIDLNMDSINTKGSSGIRYLQLFSTNNDNDVWKAVCVAFVFVFCRCAGVGLYFVTLLLFCTPDFFKQLCVLFFVVFFCVVVS